MPLVWQTSSQTDAPDTYPSRFKLTSKTQKTPPDFLDCHTADHNGYFRINP